MNLKTTLKSIWHNKKMKIICCILISLIPVSVIVCKIVDKHFEKKEEILQQQTEEYIMNQEQLSKMKEKYDNLCSEYNDSVKAYNNSVVSFNDFLSKVEKYSIINITTPLLEECNKDIDFTVFQKEGADFSELENSIVDINEKKVSLDTKHEDLILDFYNALIDEYNIVADSYTELMENTSVAFVKSIPTKVSRKDRKKMIDIQNIDEDKVIEEADSVFEQIKKVSENYIVASQITAPSNEWVKERLNTVKSITSKGEVTVSNDPNKLLDKEGGYQGCIYFAIKNIDQKSVPGSSVIEKGTDAGGAIEIYPNLEYALNRCEYLSQFDNTLLYSGSYVLVGTMLVRTSYKLSSQEQVDLTNEIIMAFTEIKESE